MSVSLSINWALWSLSFPFFFFLDQQYISEGRHHKNTDPLCARYKMPLISEVLWNLVHPYKHFPWSHRCLLFNKHLENLLPPILHNNSSGKANRTFSCGSEAADLNFPPALQNPPVLHHVHEVAFCVISAPVKLIMPKIGVAQPAPELGSFPGPRSVPNGPGSSIQF